MNYLFITHGGKSLRIPIDHTHSAINESFFKMTNVLITASLRSGSIVNLVRFQSQDAPVF